MLVNLEINNVALIVRRELPFERGLTVFSGETGSGKSIIIDAINFMLGAKADKTLIRNGADEASVTGVFDVEGRPDVFKLLSESGIPESNELIVSRSMIVSGRSEIRVNGKLVTLATLRSITCRLVDVHGQSDHFLLSDEKRHIAMLDSFGGKELSEKLSAFTKEYDEYQRIQRELSSFGGSSFERARLIDLYTYQIAEIENAKLSAREDEELEARFALLTNAERIASALQTVSEALGGDEGATSSLSIAISGLYGVSKYDAAFSDYAERLKTAKIEAEDVYGAVDSFLSELNYDEYEADRTGERIEFIKGLKRKYGAEIADILAFRDKAEAELNRLTTSEEEIARLNGELKAAKERLINKAAELTLCRKEVAKRFERAVIGELDSLSMENCRFEAEFIEGDFDSLLSRRGADSVRFLMSANVGEPLKPLSKIISGGEMSRLMLAIKSVTGNLDNIPTLIFDEVDAGISGKVAHTVAEKFIRLSRGSQLIVITHLPQIAAAADNNILISKGVTDGKTETSMKLLDKAGKLDEIIRLSGAKEKSDAAIRSAEELIAAYTKK